MATTPKEDVLTFEVAVDIRKSLKAMEKFQRQMAKSMKLIAKSGEKMGKDSAKGAKKAKEETDEWTESVEGLGDAYEKGGKQVDNLSQVITELEKKAKTLHGEEKKALDTMIKGMKKAQAERAKAGGGKGGAVPKGGMFFGRFSPAKVKEELKEAGRGLVKPLESFLDRNLKGIVEDSVKGVGGVLSRSLKVSTVMASMSADALKKKGERASFKGKAMGGAKGKMVEMGGAGMKQMGAMMGKMGSLMSTLATIGPLLSTAASAVVGLIKMFIDADALVKDFNRGIMESASNLEFLENAGGKAELAIMHMDDALTGVREAAMDYNFNNALGITKDTHTAILNTLNQEGVAMGNLASESGNSAEGMKRLTQSIVSTGVAYSRSLGVPLQEIASLQAEMAVEMGRSIEDTATSFNHMARAAAASGIAGNKFFSIIRGASADLSLWNLRLDGAIDLLGKLGKIMSPRGAQQFFQSISSGFKNMGRQDLLKQTLMAGVENVRSALKEDIGEGQKELAEQILGAGGGAGKTAEEIAAALKEGGYSAADQFIRGVTDKSKTGTLRDKAAELERKRQGAAGGTYEVSQASGEIQGVGSQITIMMKAVERLGGSLLQPNKMALAQTAENLGISQEQVKHLHSLALAADTQKKILLKQGTKSPEEIAKMTWQQILDSDESLKSQAADLSKDQADSQKTVQQSIEEMSKAQGDRTQALTQKLDNLVDWFMNQFYSLMLDIWEAIDFFTNPSKNKERSLKRAALESKSGAVQKAFAGSRGDMNAFKGNLLEGGSDFSKGLSQILAKAYRPGATAQDEFQSRAIQDAISKGMADKDGNTDVDKIMAAAGAVIKDEKKLAKIRARAEAGGSFKESLDAGGVSGQERQDVVAQGAWQIDPTKLVFLADLINTLGGEAKGSGGGAPAVSTGPAAASAEVVTAAETTNQHLEQAAQDNKKQQTIMQQQGVKIAPATIKEEAKGMEASMLSALRTALFEYYMYSGTDRGTLLTSMKEGGVTDPRAMAKMFGERSVAGGGTLSAVTDLATASQATGNARGGTVTGIANGMAVVAARGEGLASVGRGERITPAGGGGSGVHVSVNGIGGPDLARLIEGKVVEGIREYKRREKFY